MISKVVILKVAALLLFMGLSFSFMEFGQALFFSIFFGAAQWNYLGNDPDAPPAKGLAIGIGIFLLISFSILHFIGYCDHPLITGLLLAGWYACVSVILIEMERGRGDDEAEQAESLKP